MKKGKDGRKKRLRLVPLVAGAYSLILGLGLTAIGIGDLAGHGRDTFTVSGGVVRCLAGLVLIFFGVYGIWEGIRDLVQAKKDTGWVQANQFLLTGVDGKRSSYVNREVLQEQLAALAEREEGADISLQILPPVLLQGLGRLMQISYLYGDSSRLVAFFESDDGGCTIRQKEADLSLAETLLGQFLTDIPDFSHWEEGTVTVYPGQSGREKGQYLRIFGESWRDEHRFFSARDLELAVEGLEDGKYVRVEMGLENAGFRIFPGLEEKGVIVVQIYVWEEAGFRTYVKKGTMTQVKFWLAKIFHEGLGEVLAGWQDDPFIG